MPKRTSIEKIEHYQTKIRKLQEKQLNNRRRRVIIYSDSSQSEENSDNENPSYDVTNTIDAANNTSATTTLQPDEMSAETQPDDQQSGPELIPPPAQDAPAAEEAVPALDAEFLSALGDTLDEAPTYGENIHQDLAQRWQPLLRRGLSKEVKEKLLKEYAIPENCKLLRAPSLNPEISAAVTEATRSRDKKLETAQQQLGLGITSINRALSILFAGDDKQSKVQAIKMLSDACRILSDLHYSETQSRIKLITPSLDKAFLNIIQNVERDELLFGAKLSEKIKASKTIEKQGLQIKKATVTQKPPVPSTSQSTTARTRFQGNWTAPSRYQQSSNRGGKGGAHKNPPPVSSQKTAATATTHSKSLSHAKQRAPPRQ